jgi:hypothetical protein
MKTSFSTGLLNIKNGVDPSDVDHPGTAKFEIKNGSDVVSSLADGSKLNVLVIRRELEGGEHFSPNDVLKAAQNASISFAMSDELKKRYDNALTKLNDLTRRSEDILRLSLKTHSKVDPEKVVKDWMGEDYTCLNLVCSITKDVFDLAQQMPISAKEIDFISVSKSPVVRLGTDPVFTKNVASYVSCVKKDFSEKGIFNTDFTVDGLQKVYAVAVKESYFDETHKLQIAGKAYGKAETEELIQRAVKEIYGDPKNKDAFIDSKEKLAKKNVSPIKDIIDTKPDLLPEMENYQSFLRQLICLSINDFSVIEAIQKENTDLESQMSKIASESEKERPIWNETVETFNRRFFSNGFTAKLTNRNMVLLKRAPTIQLVKKHGGQPLSPALQGQLSTGEKDSLWILKIVFDIKKEQITGNTLNIILDDVADSFDYKNKYALVMYLYDLIKDPSYQVIALTHSFDFFRTVMSLGKEHISGLLAYKKDVQSIGSDVTLLACNEQVYSTLVAVNTWKNSPSIKDGFAFLPVLRNLEQISRGKSSCPSVMDLDSLMHYGPDTLRKTIADMENVFGETNFGLMYDRTTGRDDLPCPFFTVSNSSSSYYASLRSEAKAIRPSMPETDLPSKIVLALYIRMACERMMVDLLTTAHILPPPQSTRYSRGLQELVISNRLVSDQQEENIEESLLIGDSFAHMNSFIDAPLVDVGPEQLMSLFDYYFDQLNL